MLKQQSNFENHHFYYIDRIKSLTIVLKSAVMTNTWKRSHLCIYKAHRSLSGDKRIFTGWLSARSKRLT